jgi:hypothetical protein
MIRLYHYSDKDFKGYIEPGFLGNNTYTRNDKNISGLSRAFYYTEAGAVEYLLKGSKYLYITEVEPGRIYNITEDKKGYLKLYKGDIDLSLRAIKRNYKGVIYKIGYNVVNLFYPAKIKAVKTLTEAGRYVILGRKQKRVADYPLKLARVKKGGKNVI